MGVVCWLGTSPDHIMDPMRQVLQHKKPIAIIFGIILIALSVWFWGVLVGYVKPRDAGDRKDVVQTYTLIIAGVAGAIGGIVGVANLQTSRQNLQQQRDLEEQRVQEDALQSYFEQVGNLLTANTNNLKQAQPEDTEALLARAQTLRVLRRLDKDRKRILLLFLHEAGLVSREHQVIELSDADLGEANLRDAPLRRADLRKANLFKADLNGADLRGALLNSADLRFAQVNYARLDDADLSGPKPWYDLDLGARGWKQEGGADLRDADLGKAFLMGANLTNANLSSAKLKEAFFNDADLSGTFLFYAEGKTNEELHRDAESLKGAVMPNGQKYEDWIKDNEGRGENGTPS